jgi:drug/metabolite transporter (DMT)-like permease
VLLFYGIRLTDSVVAALMIGCLPLTITLFGKPHFNQKLFWGLALIVIGLLSLLVFPLLKAHQSLSFSHLNPLGLGAIAAALALWTWFAIKNAHFMSSHVEISSLDYSSLLGLISFVCITPFFLLDHGFQAVMASPHFGHYLVWSLILGVGASWIANILWAYSAKVCPPGIGGPLIVSETLFALLYSFILDKRLPFPNEIIATLTLVLGVVLSIRSQIGVVRKC